MLIQNKTVVIITATFDFYKKRSSTDVICTLMEDEAWTPTQISNMVYKYEHFDIINV